MEKKKKYYPPKEGSGAQDAGNGQRISVRPGNFTPPAAQGQKKQEPAGEGAGQASQGAQQGGHGRNRNRHRNRHRPHPQGEQAREAQQQQPRQGGQKPQRQEGKQPDRREQPKQGERNHEKAAQPPRDNAQREGGRGRRDRRRGGRGEEHRVQQPQAPALSESLQRELDEEFATPTLNTYAPAPMTERYASKRAESAVESDEFAVDIATASYLVEDVPCGFPIPDGKAVEVIGVRFRRAGRIYFFAPDGNKFAIGDRAIVDTARGPELGDVVMLNRRIAEKDIIQPLRAVLRRATPEDEAHDADNREKEAAALKVCAEKIALHKLDMRLVDAQYTFDNSKLLFYFTSDGRVDFRELVRDLAGYFHTRIELRQIGIRDESRLIGGLGLCGRPFCCATFLSDFGQVSVKMAKEQGLSINASKISGCCGRLMCCLRYEHETYVAEAKLTPKKDAVVETPDGRGVVVDSTPLLGTVKVKLDALPDEPARTYHRDHVTLQTRGGARPAPKEEAPEADVTGEPEILSEDGQE